MAQDKIIIITAPSGSGKTSIARYLLQQLPVLEFSISATTRSPRGQEVHGKEYYFLSQNEFERKIADGDFLEWEMVYQGKYYGTLKSEINRMWDNARVPLLDVDVHGAIHVQKLYPGKCLSIFIDVPTIEDLRGRLTQRGTETPESMEARLNKATHEREFRNSFNVVIINDILENAQQQTLSVVADFLSS